MVDEPPGVEVWVDMRVELGVVEEEPFFVDRVVDERVAVESQHSLRKSLNNKF